MYTQCHSFAGPVINIALRFGLQRPNAHVTLETSSYADLIAGAGTEIRLAEASFHEIFCLAFASWIVVTSKVCGDATFRIINLKLHIYSMFP